MFDGQMFDEDAGEPPDALPESVAQSVPESVAQSASESVAQCVSEAVAAGLAALRERPTEELLAALGALPPGPPAALVLAALDVEALEEAALIDVLKARNALLAHLEAAQAQTIAAFAARRRRCFGPGGSDEVLGVRADQTCEFAADEIGAALTWTRTTARNRLEHALDLTTRLPATLAALHAGRIDLAKSSVIAEETATLRPDRCAEVEERVLPRAPRQTPPLLRRSLKLAVLRADPGATKDRHQRAVADRSVHFSPLPDGMAELVWTDRADRVLGLSVAIDGLARAAKHGDDTRTAQQRRADVMADLGARLLELSGLPREHGARPHINVTVPLGTLLDLSSEPAELAGYGPIPAELARAIAAEGTWRRLLTDPASGALLDVGRDKYRPLVALREFVLTRDQYCQGHGCTVPARRCDLDHRIDWAHGGSTRAEALDALCRHTHRLKHEAGWTRERQPDGSTVWTTATGHTYVRDPDRLPGAIPPTPFTRAHQKAIREHARMLAITLPSTEAGTYDGCDIGSTTSNLRGGPVAGTHTGTHAQHERIEDEDTPPF